MPHVIPGVGGGALIPRCSNTVARQLSSSIISSSSSPTPPAPYLPSPPPRSVVHGTRVLDHDNRVAGKGATISFIFALAVVCCGVHTRPDCGRRCAKGWSMTLNELLTQGGRRKNYDS